MKGIPGIKEFPSDNQYWRVDWFGAIQPNPKVAREPALQVIISSPWRNRFGLDDLAEFLTYGGGEDLDDGFSPDSTDSLNKRHSLMS